MEKSKKNVSNTKKKKKPMKHRVLFRATSLLLLITTIVFLVVVIKLNLLDVRYILVIVGLIVLIEAFLLFVLNKRFKVAIKVPFLLIALVLSGGFIYGAYNINLATSFVSKIVEPVLKVEKYNVYVLEGSKYESISDLNKTKLGYFDNGSETLEGALKTLKKDATFKNEAKYDDVKKMLDDTNNKKNDVVFISSSLTELANEEYPDEFGKLKLIGEVEVSIKEDVKKSDIDITKEPFLMYLSGIDTYGSIGTVSRSDVNILVAVNPKTNKVLLVNTPRDYYVKLHSKKAMDKLTHAGIYGVEESMNTLGDLYATDVDYYVKVNFSSLIKIVDALGGITVDSKYNFSYDGFTFKKGTNKLSGKAALAFSRFRKGLPNGDISRGENQEAVIKGMIEKATSPSVISKYAQILKTMEKSFVTNMDEKDIYSFAKFQLSDNPQWEISSFNVTGTSSYQTTYSAGKTKLYVMMPDEESVTDVKHALNEILEEN